MGTPEFAASSLKALIEAGHEIALVVTQPDRRGNRNKMVISPVKQLAIENNLEVVQPVRIKKEPEVAEQIASLQPDMIVVAAFGQILPKSVLDIAEFGCINVHGSLLPKYRGASPMQAAILDGKETSGITIMRMDEGVDTGDMISKVKCDIAGMNISEVTEILADAGAKLLVETIPHIEDGTAIYEKQNENLASYAKMISKDDGYTDFDEPADVIERKIRAYAEWPTCYSYLNGKLVKFFKAGAMMDVAPDGKPGTISKIGKEHYTVNCSEGKLKVYEQQLQGKKRMSAGDFMRGYKFEAGDSFGAKEVE